MTDITISKQTYRRFLLGSQGLWPGRRFVGTNAAETALRQMQALQLDPLVMVARSQDIALYGRVLDYRPGHLYNMAYEKRKAFDYGGWLAMYPMEEFPHWRAIMPRVEAYSRLKSFKKKFPKSLQQVQQILRENGPMSNRDFEGESLKYWSYRGRKDTSLALYYSWLLGDVMITTRRGFDRVYDLRERVLPDKYDYISDIKEAEDFFARKQVSIAGMILERRLPISWRDSIDRKISPKEGRAKLGQMLEDNVIARVHVEGFKDVFVTLSENVKHLHDLESGCIPKAWKPKETTTEEEVTFLSPLEMVSARGRAKKVFDFDYVWEVYKPAHQRKWGYYVLPILYGDDLVARLDPKLDRTTMTLQILGFWLEDDTNPDSDFATALGMGLLRFANMIGAERIDLDGIRPAKLKSAVKKIILSEKGK